jgi:hypothetical protein
MNIGAADMQFNRFNPADSRELSAFCLAQALKNLRGAAFLHAMHRRHVINRCNRRAQIEPRLRGLASTAIGEWQSPFSGSTSRRSSATHAESVDHSNAALPRSRAHCRAGTESQARPAAPREAYAPAAMINSLVSTSGIVTGRTLELCTARSMRASMSALNLSSEQHLAGVVVPRAIENAVAARLNQHGLDRQTWMRASPLQRNKRALRLGEHAAAVPSRSVPRNSTIDIVPKLMKPCWIIAKLQRDF